ncbi:TIGR04086 family membrane protein [Phosphitispora sp. TUW77]|uniref:TIGR04086 family membrane protein n=1 Tax=Phosphitispora sp. TUW77 TaxID=3152361 RepID=UPI003AB6A44E
MCPKLTTAVKWTWNINLAAILYGSLLAVIASIILMAIGGTVMFYTIFNERLVPVIGLSILFISIFLGGLISARKAGKMGWLHGLGVGLTFLVLTLLFSMIFPNGVFGFTVLKKILASIIAGCLGGIWGVGE